MLHKLGRVFLLPGRIALNVTAVVHPPLAVSPQHVVTDEYEAHGHIHLVVV